MLITLTEATKQMHVTKRTARKWLGDPQDTTTINGKTNFLYDSDLVSQTHAAMEKVHAELKERCTGLRQCRSCEHRCKPEELTNGKCKDCRAFDICRRFCCPDLCAKCIDAGRVCAFAAAFERVIEKFSEK